MDDAAAPVLYDSNDKRITTARTPCTAGNPCVFIAGRDKEAGTVTLSGTCRFSALEGEKQTPMATVTTLMSLYRRRNLSALNAVIYQVKAASLSTYRQRR